MSELKLCPVCGGEGTYERYEDGWAICNRCGMEANSVAADALEEMDTHAERTCRQDFLRVGFKCSGCGIKWFGLPQNAFRFCPMCGAKVIEE